jgi:hypothetical protein
MGSTPSPRAAVVYGLVCAGFGVAIVLAGLGVLPSKGAHAPPWVIVCAGLAFVLMGAALIVGFAVAPGRGPDGDMLPDTPFAVRVIQYLLGLSLVGLMTAICTWIAFGPGERHFSSSVSLPFIARRSASGETSGRVAFGIGAVLLWIFLVTAGVSGARSLIRDAQKRT